MVRKHIFFSGDVQGVGFRYRSFYIAQSLGLTGWVENLWDGRVEMEVSSPSATTWKSLSFSISSFQPNSRPSSKLLMFVLLSVR